MTANAVALVSAVLVASCVAAHRLSRTMVVLAVGIYLWMSAPEA